MPKFTLILIALVTLGFTLPSASGQSGSPKNKLAILDMSDRNNQGNDYLYSCKQMATVAGVPYTVTKSIAKAANHKVVLLSSYIDENTFSQQERQLLKLYVQGGGVLFGGDVKDDPDFHPLFGIDKVYSNNTHYRLDFQTAADTALFTYFNHPREKTIALGDSTSGPIFYTHYYDYSTGEALAYLDGDTTKPALLRHQYRGGTTYALGMKLRDVMVRYLMNRDFSAERVWSNGFEPSADMMPLLLRSLCAKHMDNLVWKHTAPHDHHNAVMITHDIDSRTGMDTMLSFAKQEYQQGIKANYNITTRYFKGSLWDDFYKGKECKVDQVKGYGHVISSHSVGHFIDFDELPFGPAGLSKDQYQPFYDGNRTNKGYVLAETEVSKNILEANHNTPIQTFRAGHLLYPDKLGNALDSTGYQFNSTNSANSILYSFPFPIKANRSFDGPVTDVYEIPVTFSDVVSDSAFNADNYQSTPQKWLKYNKLYAGNYSPVTLLVHPNRNWKLKAQNDFINNLGPKHKLMNMNAYGAFWKERADLAFSYNVKSSGVVEITIPKSEKPLSHKLSFGVKGINSVNNVIVKFDDGTPLNYKTATVPEKNHLLVYRDPKNPAKEDGDYVSLPFKDSFEAVDAPMKKGWNFNFPEHTNGFSNPDKVDPAGVRIWDTSAFANVAHSGKGALGLGKLCDGPNQVAAIDLQLDLSDEDQVSLDYWIKSSGDEEHPQDGIFISDDGGQSFTKIHDFTFPNQCERYFQQPTLDIDELAAKNGLKLTEHFIIRFQQYDDQTLFGKDGIFLDDVAVTSGNTNAYANIPYQTDFEQGLGQAWETNRIDSQNWNITPQPALSSFTGIKNENEIPGVARSGKNALAFGKLCGINDVTNRADLRMDLSEADEPILSFYVKNNEDETHKRDGIWLSDDGGKTFTKIRNWTPDQWCDAYTKYPMINLKTVANKHGLALTDQFVIRFQHQDNYSFLSDFRDGFFIDDLTITENARSYASLPIEEDFEGNFKFNKGWVKRNGPETHLGDTASTGPYGWIGLLDTSFMDGIAASGEQAVGLGKICRGSAATNALDLKLDLSKASHPVLNFKVLSLEDDNKPQDGLWISDDGGSSFEKVINFKPEDWCNGYGSYPPLPLKEIARKKGLQLSDQFIIRFQQQGGKGFDGQNSDGLVIDDVEVKEKPTGTWAQLPYSEDFEDHKGIEAEWELANALLTDTSETKVTPNGLIAVTDTISGIAKSGNKALLLGKKCDGERSTNAVDLHVAAPDCQNFQLTYHVKINYDDPHPEDGIWVSVDRGETFHKIRSFNYKRAPNEYHSTVMNLDTALRGTAGSLTDSLILRFQQSDNNDLELQGRDGLFFDDIQVKCLQYSGKSHNKHAAPLKIYPNPVKERLSIATPLLKHTKGQLKITNTLGKTIIKERISASEPTKTRVNTAALKAGVYFLTLETVEGSTTSKFIKVEE